MYRTHSRAGEGDSRRRERAAGSRRCRGLPGAGDVVVVVGFFFSATTPSSNRTWRPPLSLFRSSSLFSITHLGIARKVVVGGHGRDDKVVLADAVGGRRSRGHRRLTSHEESSERERGASRGSPLPVEFGSSRALWTRAESAQGSGKGFASRKRDEAKGRRAGAPAQDLSSGEWRASLFFFSSLVFFSSLLPPLSFLPFASLSSSTFSPSSKLQDGGKQDRRIRALGRGQHRQVRVWRLEERERSERERDERESRACLLARKIEKKKRRASSCLPMRALLEHAGASPSRASPSLAAETRRRFPA